jgi:ribosome biogenesis GTPase / thiamine phosphate phosphatase
LNESDEEVRAGEMAENGAAEGVIVSHFGVAVEVLLQNGERRTVRVKRNSSHVVGDSVEISGEVLKQLPRKTELRRRDARGSVHLVAANLDVVGIVVAPKSPSGFLDRAIIATRAAGLEPFIVFNKCDLPEGRTLAEELGPVYTGIIPYFAVSAATGEGVDDIRAFIAQGHRGVFVGSTGVGKSSLLNTLCPGLNLKVQEVSEHKWQGRHTTTVSSLHALADGGELVDTPGFRDFGLVDVTAEEVVENFPGFEAAEAEGCRFYNCRHRQEPGCAVTALVNSGALGAERYQIYLAMLAEAEAHEEAARRGGKK